MNKTILTGTLVKDIEVKKAGETSILRNTIAVRRKFKDKKTNEYVSDFVNIVVWGSDADYLGKFATKGTKIALAGRIETGSYENKDGNKIYTTDIIAEDIELLTFKDKKEGTTQTPKQETPSNNAGQVNSDDLPF